MLLLETQSPEIISLIYTITKWQNLIIKSKNIYLSGITCRLKTLQPIFLNCDNDLQIEINGGPPGQRFSIYAPIVQNYEVRLSSTFAIFENSRTLIDLTIKPNVSGKLDLLLEIEGIMFPIEMIVLLQNPFIVGIPVQSDFPNNVKYFFKIKLVY